VDHVAGDPAVFCELEVALEEGVLAAGDDAVGVVIIGLDGVNLATDPALVVEFGPLLSG
jgi:hypothetical protein